MYQSGGDIEYRLKSSELRRRKSCECCVAVVEMWHNQRHDQRMEHRVILQRFTKDYCIGNTGHLLYVRMSYMLNILVMLYSRFEVTVVVQYSIIRLH